MSKYILSVVSNSVANVVSLSRYACCWSNSCWPQWSLPQHITDFRIIWLPLIPYPLHHFMMHGKELHLNCWVREVWYKCWDHHKQCHNPKGRSRSECFDEDFVSICRKMRRHCSICNEEKIPESNGSPDENMLNQGEVTYSKCHLQVHNPNDTSIHRCSEYIPPGGSSFVIKGLKLHCFCAEEENYYGTNKPIKHPAEYSSPAKEDILDTFLI